MSEIQIVKIGGNVIDNHDALAAFVQDFAKLKGLKILVHGGGKEATLLSAKMGIETKMIEGRRVTDADTLGIVTMVYAGLVNKRIVSMLQRYGCNAIGLSGADGNAIQAARRPANPIDYGFVGDISAEGVNSSLFKVLLDQGLTPVVCAIMHDGNGTLLNCNADGVASSIAIAMASIAKANLTYCFEKAGVLKDIADPNSVIPLVTPDNYAQLRYEGVISAGMIPKVDNALRAIAQGVSTVRIQSAADISQSSGTLIAPTCN